MNEHERINHFPNSELYEYMREVYQDELEFHAEPISWGEPEPLLTPEELINSLMEGYGFDPLENADGDDIARMWADMAYPLPHNAEDILAYGGDANGIALSALREYVNLYDLRGHAERVLAAEKERREND